MDALYPLLLTLASDPAPEAEDVKAGWVAFGIFLAGCVVVAVLGYFLVRQLRTTQRNKEAGVFGDEPAARSSDTDETGTETGTDADTDR